MPSFLRRRMATFIRIAFAGMALTLLFTGCTSADVPTGGSSSSGRIVALLVDQTCDATPALTDLSREALTKSVDAAATDRGTFLGEAITTDAYQTGTFSVSHAFTSDKRNDRGIERDLARQARDFRALPTAESLTQGYQAGTPCGSDLINALTAAERAFEDEPGGSGRSRDLVFVTNGIVVEPESGINFITDDMTARYAQDIIDRQKASDLFPDLTGVSVHLVGLGISDQNLTAEKVRQLESFWAELARAAGAREVVTVRSAGQLMIGGGH